MTEFIRADLRGSRFDSVYLSESTFEQVDMSNGTFRDVLLRRAVMTGLDLTDANIRDVALHRVVIRGAELVNTTIYGDIENVTINGVDIGPLINGELNRRYPERAKMRPTDPAGFREAWEVVERLWAATVKRARGFDPDVLHESVGDEWSFIETLRHLVFATESWLHRCILGDPAPWHPLSLPWDQMPDTPGVPRDRAVRPSLDAVLEVRRDRMTAVRTFIDGLTDESLAADTEPVEAPGWPRPVSYPVRECLLIILNEEWEHRVYAERDLDALQARTSDQAQG